MAWHGPDEPFTDRSIPKLANLARAARAGLRVPPSAWAWAAELDAATGRRRLRDLRPPFGPPCIVRSGSPTEDTAATSNAGQFASVVVRHPAEFPAAVAEVLGSLPVDGQGRRQGVVFVQPLVEAVVGGVTFFDGFYYEETSAPGGNAELTAGRARGQVVRGHLQRGDAQSAWLRRVHRAFGGTLDLEWAQPERGERVLLQARPALFPVRRNPTLSLANHKEILGDPPSPWIAGVVVECGPRVLDHYAAAEPAVLTWGESYAADLAGRAWMNYSFFLRLMDHWGLPRTMVSHGVGGGDPAHPADARVDLPRLLRKLPALARMAFHEYATVFRIKGALRRVDATLERAGSLLEIQRANVDAFELSIRTNLALMSLLSVALRIRRFLGLERSACVVTHGMMAGYAELAARPTLADRLAGLEDWLGRYGHRGPLESDPRRPRFAELRGVLEADLRRGPRPAPRAARRPPRLVRALAHVLFQPDEWREQFRDGLMRTWQRLRARILEESQRAVDAGHLDAVDDAFFLRSDDLAADPSTWRERAAARRADWHRARDLELPTTAPRDVIEAIADGSAEAEAAVAPERFRGVGLGGRATVAGTVVRAASLDEVLGCDDLPESPVLVASTLEPSWAVVFPRFAAVVAELGGEMSHAAILLREASIPAVVNARGAFANLRDGDRVRVDPARGEVAVAARPEAISAGAGELFNKAC